MVIMLLANLKHINVKPHSTYCIRWISSNIAVSTDEIFSLYYENNEKLFNEEDVFHQFELVLHL
jgi:hypothetical protein